MRCPDCNSKNVTFERKRGYFGYRCDDCEKWNYGEDMKSDIKLKPAKCFKCRHCNKIHHGYIKAFKCCNPV